MLSRACATERLLLMVKPVCKKSLRGSYARKVMLSSIARLNTFWPAMRGPKDRDPPSA
jgi:hypothetical protein